MKLSRRELLKLCATSVLAACDAMKPVTVMNDPQSARMPILFVGHGSPMHAIADNVWSQGFLTMGKLVPRPKAILSISAHWYGDQKTSLTAHTSPPTIHDFGGFPQRLYEVEYPAPGSPSLAARVRTLLGEDVAQLTTTWGLDHGTWSVLRHAFPDADIPVVQLSIDARLTPEQHINLGRELRELRDDGVLIFGTGNITHNLRSAMGQMRSGDTTVPGWSAKFDAEIATTVEQRDTQNFTEILHKDYGRLSHPTPDHYIPLLYTYGATTESDRVSYPITGFDIGLSMRSVLWTPT